VRTDGKGDFNGRSGRIRKEVKLTDVSDYAVRGSNSFRNVCDIYCLERRHGNKALQNVHICTWMFIPPTSLLVNVAYSSFQTV
jgi:hypothetical protein